MKRIVPLAAALTLAAGPLLAQSAAQKIGIIDVQRIVQESAVGKESLARLWLAELLRRAEVSLPDLAPQAELQRQAASCLW